MQSEGYPSQSHVSRFESQISRNQSQSVAISRNQSQSVALTCEPVDSNPSGALLPRPRAVPGIPTVLLRELLGELELAPDEGRNQAQSVAISRNQTQSVAPFEVEPAAVVLHQPRVEHVREHLGREIERVPK